MSTHIHESNANKIRFHRNFDFFFFSSALLILAIKMLNGISLDHLKNQQFFGVNINVLEIVYDSHIPWSLTLAVISNLNATRLLHRIAH